MRLKCLGNQGKAVTRDTVAVRWVMTYVAVDQRAEASVAMAEGPCLRRATLLRLAFISQKDEYLYNYSTPRGGRHSMKCRHPTSTFGQFIRAAREARGVTASALAEECDVSRSYLSLIESDRANPPCNAMLFTTARFLGIPEDDLFVAAGRLPPDVNVAEAVALYRKHHVEPRHMHKPSVDELFEIAARNQGYASLQHLAQARRVRHRKRAGP